MSTNGEDLGSLLGRSYDHLKHLAGLSVASIGGVLALLSNDGPAISKNALAVILTTLAMAAVVAQLGLSAVTMAGTLSLRISDRRLATIATIAQALAIILLLFGLGVFLGAFSKTL